MNVKEIDELLFQAELSLASNDKNNTAKILSQIIVQDINNDPAWKLLYQLYESKQPFEEFRDALAKKYFPSQYHLLVENKTSNPLNRLVPLRQETPRVDSPIVTAKSVPVQIPSKSQISSIKCAHCGKLVLKESKCCPNCGKLINPERDGVQPVPSVAPSTLQPLSNPPQTAKRNNPTPYPNLGLGLNSSNAFFEYFNNLTNPIPLFMCPAIITPFEGENPPIFKSNRSFGNLVIFPGYMVYLHTKTMVGFVLYSSFFATPILLFFIYFCFIPIIISMAPRVLPWTMEMITTMQTFSLYLILCQIIIIFILWLSKISQSHNKKGSTLSRFAKAAKMYVTDVEKGINSSSSFFAAFESVKFETKETGIFSTGHLLILDIYKSKLLVTGNGGGINGNENHKKLLDCLAQINKIQPYS